MADIKREVERLNARLPGAVLSVEERPERGMFWIEVRPSAIVPAVTLLRDDPELDYAMLADLHGQDFPDREKRFECVYSLYSFSRAQRLFLRVRVAEGESVPSISSVFPNADWCEREIYDLFGVPFTNHPDLRRILMPDDWDGHPLRKDYPLVGRRPVILFNSVDDIT
ncbi:MAG: NADH-quinone oxidoreductase subunit C [Armatimonadetes bacterium]|nr:NADH-quinone oxidoreductase subunit C [Armatimonadota bacterium]